MWAEFASYDCIWEPTDANDWYILHTFKSPFDFCISGLLWEADQSLVHLINEPGWQGRNAIWDIYAKVELWNCP